MNDKLKTLNELGFSGVANLTKKEYVSIEDLKAEAVKWVKLYDENSKTNNLIQNFIRTFFNLTEKELVE